MVTLSMANVELPTVLTLGGIKLRAGWCSPDHLVVSRVDLEAILAHYTGATISFSAPAVPSTDAKESEESVLCIL